MKLSILLFLLPNIIFSKGSKIAQQAFLQLKDKEAIILDVREKWETKIQE